jgi:O-antigen ligase
MSSVSADLDARPTTAPESAEPLWEILIVPVIGFIIVRRCLYDSGTGLDVWFLLITLVFSAVFVFARSGAGRMNWVDGSLFVVVVSETAGYFNSTYRPNSLHDYQEVLFLALFYCLVRLHLRHEYQRAGVFLLLSLFGLCLSVAALTSFGRQYANLTSLGFDDPTSFRAYFSFLQPPGVPTGEWITIFLVLLPFPVLLFLKFADTAKAWASLCPAGALLLTITVTFSRGLYVATAIFFISAVLLFRLYGLAAPLKRFAGFSLCALVLVAAVVSVTPVRGPVLTTAAMFRTASQVRSFEGRADLWKASWEVVKARPLFGVGALNFPMQYAAYKAEDSVYVGRTFNIFLQLLVEKGLAGLLAYGLLFLSFFKVAHDNIRRLPADSFQKAVSALLMASCLALLVRDLSYSSTFVNDGVSALLWFVFAISARPEPPPDDAGGVESRPVS